MAKKESTKVVSPSAVKAKKVTKPKAAANTAGKTAKSVSSSKTSPAKSVSKPATEKKVASSKPTASKSVKTKKSEVEQPEHFSLFSELDIYLFKQGKHYKLYEKLGAHIVENKGVLGTFFAVWAPNASHVSVIGDFNEWNPESGRMSARLDGSGIWEVFIPSVGHGDYYKYIIRNAHTGEVLEKFDPFAFFNEIPPKRASIVWDLSFKHKADKRPKGHSGLDKAWSIYEVHAGSWKKPGPKEDDYLTYADMAKELVPYVKEMGFTHVEFLPLTEHPYSGSWGYQTTGFFAPTSRFGTPQEFMQMIDAFHDAGVGVIIDWVPSHFPEDSYALAMFDGTRLYEHQDPRKGFHPDWKSLIFNYGRYEVRSFLISSAMFWADYYKIDGLRVDAVASMLYLDYSRNDGEWEANEYGGNENLEAISFLKELNEALYTNFPEIQVIAEESTSWPMVSRPVYLGGLGFGMKWMMGWMHDTLKYFGTDPIYREYHQNDITFSIYYAFTENFMLPLSHDEVVHGKGSLIQRMPGDEWQRFANLRTMYSYMFTHPGTKLLFMGAEFAQYAEWNYKQSLDWHLLEFEPHKGVSELIKSLNKLYQSEPALYEENFSNEGFEWIDLNDFRNSTLSYIRKSKDNKEHVVIVANLTPVPRDNYRIGLPSRANYELIFNSDDKEFWGSGFELISSIKPDEIEQHGRSYSAAFHLPPLSIQVYKPKSKKVVTKKAVSKTAVKQGSAAKN
jgi:1,4-alpha-glucan branching enzyme